MKSKVRMIMIYTLEAHATDIWPIGRSAGVLNESHKTIEDRKQCAEKFIDTFDFKIPVYLDTMDNGFETEFSSWPFRYYIIKDGKFVMVAEPSDAFFEIEEMYKCLESLDK